MKYKLEERNGAKYLKLDSIDMKIDVHDYDIHISDLFKENPEIGKNTFCYQMELKFNVLLCHLMVWES